MKSMFSRREFLATAMTTATVATALSQNNVQAAEKNPQIIMKK